MKTKRNFRKLSNKKKTRKNRKQIGGFIGRFFRKSDDKLRPKDLLKRRRKQLIKAIEEEQRNSDKGIEKKIKSLHLEYLQLRNKVDDDIMAEIIEKNVENGRRKFYYLSNMYKIEYLNSPQDHPVIKKEKEEREKFELVV